MIVGLFISGFVVLLLSMFIPSVGTSNALMISTLLFVSALVLSLVKSKRPIK